MAETRAERLESLFHQALSLKGDVREKFLAEACQHDKSLYDEVTSLLAHHQVEDELLERMAMPAIPQESWAESTFKEGDQVGPYYEIIRYLGQGGMGEVFLARDHRLGRKVALKILPREFAQRSTFIDRLRREALAASGLDHPNILTIYEFGEHDGFHYIVSEFVQGSSLRDHIGSIPIHKALDYANQIGRALAAAHVAGIVHRDIKPENIMVRPDGFIKVLDFGLAKPDNTHSDASRSLFARLANAGENTVPGLILGTIKYMSPEQARGENVDRRADIWTWGVVLYEMLNGRRPFEALPSRERPPTSNNRKQLNRVLKRALAESPRDRYQHMSDALADLARIPARERKLNPDRGEILHKIFGVDQKSRLRHGAALVLLGVIGAAGYLFYQHRINAPIRIERTFSLTTSGNITQAAISSDGNDVAYVATEGSRQVLRMRTVRLSEESGTKKLWETTAEFTGIAFARDGQSIYYVIRQDQIGKLYRLQLGGGVPKMVMDDVDSSITFSPEGERFAFFRTNSNTRQSTLVVKGRDVGAETNLATLTAPDYFWTAPVWSPDGSSLAFGILSDSEPGSTNLRMMSIALSDRKQRVVGPQPWYSLSKPIWVKGGRGLVFSATPNNSNVPLLLEMSWPKGDTSKVPLDPSWQDGGDWEDIDANADQSRLIVIRHFRRSGPWIIPLSHPLDVQQVPGGPAVFYGIAWTKSGSLISQADMQGHPDLWSIHPTTGELKRLTNDASVEQEPLASPDGRYLVYGSNREGIFHLWRSNADGSDPIRLTADGSREEGDGITPDGKSVIFTSIKSGFPALWRVSIEGGAPIQLTNRSARKPAVSPKGDFIVCDYVEKPMDGWKTAILQAATGEPVHFFPNIPAGDDAIPVQWSADGKSLLFVLTDKGISNIWMQPIDGGKAKQITYFKQDRISAFALSFDGRLLACIRGVFTSNAVMVQTTQ